MPAGEAAQQLALLVLGDLQSGRNEVDERLVSAFSAVLSAALDDSQDKAALANLLILPTEAYLAEIAEVVDVDAIHQARESLRRHLASALDEQFLAVYQHCSSDDFMYSMQMKSPGAVWKNSVLNYLVALDKKAYWSLARAQYDSATNMTDSSAAARRG